MKKNPNIYERSVVGPAAGAREAYHGDLDEVVLREGRVVRVCEVRVEVQADDEEQSHADDVHDHEEGYLRTHFLLILQV